MQVRKILQTACLGLAAAACLAVPAHAANVDLLLVLAVDASGSIDQEEYRMQHDGYAAALASDAVVSAIGGGENHAIAVTYVEWSGAGHQRQLVPWTLIDDKASATNFAAAVKGAPRAFEDWTSIIDAIDYSARLFDDSGYAAPRRVIDISGDGINNSGRAVTEARDEAVAKGIVVNGLPILTDEPKLDAYYLENVIGGDGAFAIPVKDFGTFSSALLNKLVSEIAGLPTSSVRVAVLLPSPRR